MGHLHHLSQAEDTARQATPVGHQGKAPLVQEMKSRDSEVHLLEGIIRSYDKAIEQMEGFKKALKRREAHLVDIFSMSEMTS